MKIFICWSGEWGKGAAEQIKAWLCEDVFRDVLRDTDDVLVSGDITKGVLWFDELTGFLDQASAALVCLTPAALRSRWVHYEVGAVAKALTASRAQSESDSRLAPVFTLLLGVNAGEIDGPLASFQSTSVQDATDTRRLMGDLLRLVGDGVGQAEGEALNRRWPVTWKKLQERLAGIPKPYLTDVFPEFDGLFRRKTFQESIFECVNQKWLERYDGACATLKALRDREATIEQACRPHVVDMYKALIATVDEYAMAVSLLVGTKTFEVDTNGRVVIDPVGAGEACELRRKRIKSLVARLTDPLQAAQFEEAFRFEVAESPAEKKSFIQRRAADVGTAARALLDPRNDGWRSSDWDYDRIIYSLCLEARVRSSPGASDLPTLLGTALERATMDLERAQVREGMYPPPDCCHLMTLSYALGPLECVPMRTAFDRTDELEYLVRATRELLARGHTARDARKDPAVMAMWESFETVIDNSLGRIERVFGLGAVAAREANVR